MSVLLEDHLPVVKYQGLNTNKAVSLGSTLAVTGATTLTGATTVTGALAVDDTTDSTSGITGSIQTDGGLGVAKALYVGTTSTLSGAVNYKRQVTTTGGAYATAIVLTEAQSGRVILVDNAAGLDFTLPAIAAAQIGVHYRFLVTTTITSNNFRVTAAAGDLLNGAVWLADFDTANTGAYFAANGSSNIVITMNGSTTGGKKGTWLDMTAISATGWFVQGVAFGDGTLATPFSG